MTIAKRIEDNFKEINKDCKQFIDFIKSNTLMSIVTAFFLILCYGIKLFYYSISIDTEVIIDQQDGLLASWLSIQRYGFILTKKIFGFLNFNPYVANFFMICAIFIFLLLWAFIFNYLSFETNRKSTCLIVFTVLFLSSPLFTEQFNFTLQGFETAIAIILCAIAVFSVSRWVLDSSNFIYLILGIVCMVWSFGSYQAVVLLYISAALSAYILIYIANAKRNIELEKDFFKWAVLKYVVSFVIGYALFSLISKIIMDVYYPGQEYLNGQILWGNAPVSACIENIKNYIKSTLSGEGIFYNKGFTIAVMLLGVYGLINLFSKRKDKILFLLAVVAFILSPYYLSMYLGTSLVPRSQFALQFVEAFGIYFIINIIENKKVKVVAVLLTIFIALHQSYICANLFYTDYMKYEGEKELALKISMKIDDLNLGATPQYPVVFVGTYHPNTTINEIDGDVIGKSFFEWDAPSRINFRIHGFLQTIGYSYVYPSDEQIEKGINIAKNMEVWPNSNSVMLRDGIIVVKLSE